MTEGGLTAQQRQAFEDRLKELGIDPQSIAGSIGLDHDSPMELSTDDQSAIKPHIVRVRSVQEMKRLVGNPDEHYETGLMEEHHAVPDAWPEGKNDLRRNDLSPENHVDVQQAHLAWIYGNSARVESYEHIINATQYPSVVPVFAADSFNVTAKNSPVVITPAMSGHLYGTVTIFKGGQIKFEGHVDFNCQKMIQSDAVGP